MGLFSLTQELAIDLGTANTLIMHNSKVVVDEPSIVALSIKTGDLMAIGHKARMMDGKTHSNIRTIRPLKNGVIADFEATELMLRGLIKKTEVRDARWCRTHVVCCRSDDLQCRGANVYCRCVWRSRFGYQ